MKLLIADDNRFIRRLLRLIVEKYFDEILECENGFDAFQAFIDHKPDWVLMDIEMPQIDGLTATKAIIKKYPQAKIILLSEDVDNKSQEFAMKAGACAYAPKDNLLKIRSIIKM